MGLIISSIAQGILWGILALGVFISFRILKIADMSAEGSFPLGAAICVVCILNGIHPVIATILSFIFGMLSGAITGILITKCKIPSLLAGILTMSGLLSINLKIMNSPNLNILNYDTVFNLLPLSMPNSFQIIIIGGLIVSSIIVVIHLFFNTELGQSLIATGDNEKMARSLGISTNAMYILGLMISNGLIALSGAILAQNNGYADVNSGIGIVVIALAAIIIGEIVFGNVSFLERLVYIICGSIIYRLLLLVVIQLPFVSATDFKLFSAMIIALFLTLPTIKKKGKTK